MTRQVGASSLVKLLGAWAGRGPAYQDLAGALRLLVLDGRVPLETALPGERELASALGLSRTTVAAAYALLRDQGHLRSRRGARSLTALPAGRPGPLSPPPGLQAPEGVLDLAYATLPAPVEVTHEAYTTALGALAAYLPGHGYEPAGLLTLRAAIADRYTERGLPTRPEQVLVTSGAQHALGLLVRLLTGPGDRVVVDHPSYPHALDALRQADCRLVPVGFGTRGWDLDGMRAALRQTSPRLAYVIADFHNPTGQCMDAGQRQQLVRAVRDSRTVLVIDETLVDLGLDAPPPAPVASHGVEVVTIGSMSKSFWGGLRIGWVRGPAALVGRLAAARTTLDLGSPVLEQLAAVALLARADQVLVPRREQLRQRRATLLTLLAEQLPDWRAAPSQGGLSLWVELPQPVSTPLAALAPRFGLRLAPGPRFGVDGAFERHLRLPYTLPEPQLHEAVSALARTYNAVAGDGLRAADLPAADAVA